jgi:hypothetical protein
MDFSYGNVIEILGITNDENSIRIEDFIKRKDIDTFSVKIGLSKLTYLNKERMEEFQLMGKILLTVQKLKE